MICYYLHGKWNKNECIWHWKIWQIDFGAGTKTDILSCPSTLGAGLPLLHIYPVCRFHYPADFLQQPKTKFPLPAKERSITYANNGEWSFVIIVECIAYDEAMPKSLLVAQLLVFGGRTATEWIFFG